jgi:hypothetical protein
VLKEMISRLGMKKAEVVIGRNQVILLCHHILQLRAAQAEFEALDSFRSDHTGSYRTWFAVPFIFWVTFAGTVRYKDS